MLEATDEDRQKLAVVCDQLENDESWTELKNIADRILTEIERNQTVKTVKQLRNKAIAHCDLDLVAGCLCIPHSLHQEVINLTEKTRDWTQELYAAAFDTDYRIEPFDRNTIKRCLDSVNLQFHYDRSLTEQMYRIPMDFRDDLVGQWPPSRLVSELGRLFETYEPEKLSPLQRTHENTRDDPLMDGTGKPAAI